MRIIKCDRCDKQIDVQLATFWSELRHNGVALDLCPKCAEQFDVFMRNDIILEEPKQEPETKPKKLDTGKLFALYDASWSIKAIADELGVTQQTVRNWLKRRENGGEEESDE